MSDYQITACSTADLPLSFFEQTGIPFACFYYELDGVEYPDDLGRTVSFDQFYENMKKGAMPTTSQVSVGRYVELFTPILQQGKDILHISVSGGLSGSYQSATIAAAQLKEEYPDQHIEVVNSLGASGGYGMLVDMAYENYLLGMTLQENAKALIKKRLRVHHWFFSTDLTAFYRGGRISAASAVFGTALKICPLLRVTAEGKLAQYAKCRGKKNAMAAMVNKMVESAKDGLQYNGKCFITHSACYDDARTVADAIEKKFKHLNGPVQICSIGTVVGSHTGPGTVALFFEGQKDME